MWVERVLCALDGWAAGKVGEGPPRAPLREHAGSSPGGQGGRGLHHCCPARGSWSLPLLSGTRAESQEGLLWAGGKPIRSRYSPPALYTSLKGQSLPLYKGLRTWSPCSEQVRDQSRISPPRLPTMGFSAKCEASGPPHMTSPKGCLSVFMPQQVASLRRSDPRAPFPALGASPSLLPYPVGPSGPAWLSRGKNKSMGTRGKGHQGTCCRAIPCLCSR